VSGAADPGPRVIVALDFPGAEAALACAARLSPDTCRLKVGQELFTRAGPAVLEALAARGFEVFLDLKYHDIPNTVAGALRAAAALGVWMVNVHAAGGPAMLEAAREALAHASHRPLLVAVTLLTSLDRAQLAALGIEAEPAALVERWSALAAAAGLDGVVCSAQEAARLRAAAPAGFVLVTPGIRPAGSGGDDQRRIATPLQALRDGADYLVIGRPVTQSDDPCRTLLTINEELARFAGR